MVLLLTICNLSFYAYFNLTLLLLAIDGTPMDANIFMNGAVISQIYQTSRSTSQDSQARLGYNSFGHFGDYKRSIGVLLCLMVT